MLKIEHANLKQFLQPIAFSDTKNGYKAIFKDDLVGLVGAVKELKCGEPTDFALVTGVHECDKGFGFQSWTINTVIDLYRYAHDEIPTLLSKAYKAYPHGKKQYGFSSNIGVSPYIRLNLEKTLEYLEKTGQANPTIHDINGDSQYILFGEYPQTLCSMSENFAIETIYSGMLISQLEGVPYKPKYKEDELIETGKRYLLGVENSNQRGTLGASIVGVQTGSEILFRNQKYVKVPRNDYHKIASSVLSNGKEIRKTIDCKGSNLWAAFFMKVEPIKWRILNWNDMPKAINPVGTGRATYIECMSDRTLIGGLPYHPSTDSKRTALYQNSTVRGFLNGINVEDPENMNEQWFCTGGGNFELFNISFLNSAFSSISCEIQIEQETGEIKYSKRRARGYGLKLKKNLSVDDQIKYYINSGKSFMLHGPSGIGKSRRVQEADPNFVSIVLRNGMLPEEVIGKTVYKTTKTAEAGEWLPPAWYKKLCDLCESEPDKNHVLFIDEITNVKPSEQSLVFHLVLNHSIGPNIGKLPQNAVVVAAGNSIEESEAAYNMPEPLFRRFEGHIELKPNYKDFIYWGSQLNENGRPKVHPVVTAFIGAYGEQAFYSSYDSEESRQYAIDPRGWEQISEMIYKNDGEVVYELLENKLGTTLATSLWAFLERPLISVEDIVEDAFTMEDIPTKLDEKYALTLSLQSVSVENVKKVREFIGAYLSKKMLALFDTVWAGNDNERALIVSALDAGMNL